MNDRKEFLEIMDEPEADPWYELIEEEDKQKGANKNILGVLRFSFAKGDTQNSNMRMYPSEILEREVAKMKEKIEKTKVAGCLDHPFGANSELARISHLIIDVNWDAEKRKAKAEAAILDTQRGKDLLTLLNSGLKLGASMRGTGKTDQLGVVQKDYQLHSVDLVANPSFGAAAQVSGANLVYESGNFILEGRPMLTVEDKIKLRYDHAINAGCRLNYDQYKEQVMKIKS